MVAATDRHQQGGSGDQHKFRRSAALMAKWDGIILEGTHLTDWRPSTCGEDRPVKSSSVPAQKRLLVAPRMRRVRARPVGRLANK